MHLREYFTRPCRNAALFSPGQAIYSHHQHIVLVRWAFNRLKCTLTLTDTGSFNLFSFYFISHLFRLRLGWNMAYPNLVNWPTFHCLIATFGLHKTKLALVALVGVPPLHLDTLAHFGGAGCITQLDHELVALGQQVIDDGGI